MELSADSEKNIAGQRARASILSQSGQGVLEYILVLMIVVLIALGMIAKFNESFSKFLGNYFGQYLACLIETGELPALGGEEGVTQGECDAGFDKFSFDAGRPVIQAESGNIDGGGSRGGASRGRPARFNSSGSGTNGESSNSFVRGNRPGKQNLPTNKEAQRGDPTSAPNASSTIIIRRRGRSNNEPNIINGQFVARNSKEIKKKVTKFKRSAKEKEIISLRSSKVPINQNALKPQVPPKIEMKSYSLAGFLKILVIIGILIAILVFVGGQAVQIKKSWQKGD